MRRNIANGPQHGTDAPQFSGANGGVLGTGRPGQRRLGRNGHGGAAQPWLVVLSRHFVVSPVPDLSERLLSQADALSALFGLLLRTERLLLQTVALHAAVLWFRLRRLLLQATAGNFAVLYASRIDLRLARSSILPWQQHKFLQPKLAQSDERKTIKNRGPIGFFGWLGSNEVSTQRLNFRGLGGLDPGHPFVFNSNNAKNRLQF
jgi:hypothetical protein